MRCAMPVKAEFPAFCRVANRSASENSDKLTTMKFISWNVNGIRACCEKGFREIFAELDADIFCLQETKVQAGQIDLNFEGYHAYWNYAEKALSPQHCGYCKAPELLPQ